MDDLISRKAAINLLHKWSGGFDYIEMNTHAAIKEFEALPSAEPKDTIEMQESDIDNAVKFVRDMMGGKENDYYYLL